MQKRDLKPQNTAPKKPSASNLITSSKREANPSHHSKNNNERSYNVQKDKTTPKKSPQKLIHKKKKKKKQPLKQIQKLLYSRDTKKILTHTTYNRPQQSREKSLQARAPASTPSRCDADKGETTRLLAG